MNQFRIGGVYRDVGGNLNLVAEVKPDDKQFGPKPIEVWLVNAKTGERSAQNGWRSASGLYVHEKDDPTYASHLIPGELHQVNGQWVPIPSKLSSLTEPNCAERDEIDAFRCQPAHVSHVEPEREPLDWNKPTPFDSFPGFVVDRFDADDLMPGAFGFDSPLQRFNDGTDALHGSAFLRG